MKVQAALEHEADLRQRMAELTERIHMDCGRAHEARTSGALESGTKLVVPGLVGSGISRAMVCRRNMGRETAALEMEVENLRGAVFGAARTGRCPSGFGSCDGRVCDHGFAAAAVSQTPAESVQADP